MEAMIALNVAALTRLTYAAAPGFVARGGGTIVNIASIVARGARTAQRCLRRAARPSCWRFSQSLQHELADKGVRVQAVLPGATATEFWDIAGLPVENLPAEIVMSADDMVDAALAGLDLGELVTIPSLPDAADWDAYEAARRALGPTCRWQCRPSATRPASRPWYSRLCDRKRRPSWMDGTGRWS